MDETWRRACFQSLLKKQSQQRLALLEEKLSGHRRVDGVWSKNKGGAARNAPAPPFRGQVEPQTPPKTADSWRQLSPKSGLREAVSMTTGQFCQDITGGHECKNNRYNTSTLVLSYQ
jgi:hypothetical protein